MTNKQPNDKDTSAQREMLLTTAPQNVKTFFPTFDYRHFAYLINAIKNRLKCDRYLVKLQVAMLVRAYSSVKTIDPRINVYGKPRTLAIHYTQIYQPLNALAIRYVKRTQIASPCINTDILLLMFKDFLLFKDSGIMLRASIC